ncbi:hypothetical protein AMS68_007262 [Peltaster fructicola]|uniref:RRM domain-containing protein n=1 Tax=Peltaster fructicola TaxID=286661 RepID=A0A6H0Y492_9PEZI|nr:hypothetical protein AMS68_007262 [Peltaster fructicola]
MAPARKKQRLSADAAAVSAADDEVPDQTAEQPAESSNSNAASSQGRSLFVRSLPTSTTSESLAEFFSESYPVKHAVAVTDPATKECRGYGFVTFADQEDAQKAKVEFNGKLLDGKKIRIELAEARERGDKAGVKNEAKAKREQERLEAQQPPKLIIRNLPWTIKRSEQLADLFKKYGKIKEAYIPKRSGGLLPGFGFVVMRSRKHAEKIIESENGKEVDGRVIAVDWAVKKEVYQQAVQEEPEAVDASDALVGDSDADTADEEQSDQDNEEEDSMTEQSNEDEENGEEEESPEFDWEANKQEDRSATLFIRNLPFTCTDEDLEDHFSAFGDIRYARIVMDAGTDRPKGNGFVCFRAAEDADACLRGAPIRSIPSQASSKDDKSTGVRSILQNTDSDPSGKYTIDGRVVLVSRAVDKSEANRLTQEGVAHRYRRDRDKRRLYLLSEGTISTKSKLWESLPPSERTMREASAKQRKTLIENNPSLHLSFTRLSVRNIPRNIDSKALKALAREAIVGFAIDVKAGKRMRISEEELGRGGEEMKEADRLRREAGKGVVKQAKVVFEGEGGGKVEESSGAGRSRGYGFIEYHTHRNALMGLRWLNGHSIGYQVKDPEAKMDREALQDRKKRLIVEFAIENAQVVLRRKDREEKAKDRGRKQTTDPTADSKMDTKKRKRDARPTKNEPPVEPPQPSVDEKVAQRNRIIGRKRALRRNKRGQK